MSKVLLKEIIPRFGLPRHLQSNNAPLFVVKVTQQFLQLLPPPFILETSVLRKNGMDQANRLYPKENLVQTLFGNARVMVLPAANSPLKSQGSS